MATPIPTRRKMLQVDFFTPAHRLSTQVNVFGHTLADQLNDPRVSWINLEMAYISRIEKPGEIIADYAISTLRKDQVSLAMISGSTEGAVKKIAQVEHVLYAGCCIGSGLPPGRSRSPATSS